MMLEDREAKVQGSEWHFDHPQLSGGHPARFVRHHGRL